MLFHTVGDALQSYTCVTHKFISFFNFVCFFQAEDGIRDAQESRGLGDVYKRQSVSDYSLGSRHRSCALRRPRLEFAFKKMGADADLSLIHI